MGNIDPAPFVDADGKAYLYVSTDWSCEAGDCTLAPELSVIPLRADLLAAAGPRAPLMAGLAGTWEQAPWAPVVENPWVVERDGVYHLLYSGGAWTGAYGMGHATSDSPTGPFTRTGRVLAPTAAVHGPGGGMLVTGPRGGDWLVYHGRTAAAGAARTLRIDRVRWPAGAAGPTVGGPTAGPVAEAP
jgi:beta-xylosidase